jgi:2Fe-2S ferredoxin
VPTITFVLPDGTRKAVEAKPGHTLLEVAQKAGLDVEGACEGSLSCSTCHLIIAPDWYARLPEASDEENDMLDLASGLTRTSRLSCQLIVEKDWDGMEVRLPSVVRNMALS